MTSVDRYDVAIVGASIAGCSAAILFARQGLRVALIERRSDPDAYKVLCSHYIQASAQPAMKRLGVADAIEAAGGVQNSMFVWTPWGWVDGSLKSTDPTPIHGYSIRREVLDPMLRKMAADTPGVDLMLGHRLQQLITDGRRTVGLEAEARDGTIRSIRAQLVVGADGMNSSVAELAGLPAREMPHKRCGFAFYYRDLPLPTGRAGGLWFLDPDIAFVFPNDDGVSVIGVMMAREKFAEFNEKPEENLARYFERVPDAPNLLQGTVVKRWAVSDFINLTRRASKPGVALIGDAAITNDYLWGMGCGRAFQSAEWLVEKTVASLRAETGLDKALRAYRRKLRWELAAHSHIGAMYSTGRRFNPIEKLMYSAAARDTAMAQHLIEFGRSRMGVSRFMAPTALARALWVNVAHRTPIWPALPAPSNQALSD